MAKVRRKPKLTVSLTAYQRTKHATRGRESTIWPGPAADRWVASVSRPDILSENMVSFTTLRDVIRPNVLLTVGEPNTVDSPTSLVVTRALDAT